jgi:hypothetical protein
MRLVGEWGGKCCGGDNAKPSLAEIQAALSNTGSDRHLVFIAHVLDSSHFVLLTGWDAAADSFRVNDPGFSTTHYAFADISDILVYSMLPTTAVVPLAYPLFKQSDYRWGSDLIRNETVGQVGCLMSSTAMALAGHHLELPVDGGATVRPNPGTLNAWLLANHGYTDGNDFIESALPAIDPHHIRWNATAGSMHTQNDLSRADVQAMLAVGAPVIANVDRGRHFVLVTGTDTKNSTVLYVNDPGFYRASYDWSQVC